MNSVKIEPHGPIRGEMTLISTWLCPRDEQMNPLSPRLPLNLVYLASALTRAGFRVYVCDLQLLDIRESLSVSISDLVLQALNTTTTPIVGLSCMSDMLPFTLLALEMWKVSNPESFVILGGPGPTGGCEEVLERFDCVDIVVRGEGEDTIVELLQAYYGQKSYDEVRGIGFKQGKQVGMTPPRPRIIDLDDLLPLCYSSFSSDDYYGILPVATSRGCPYECTFCSASYLWDRKTTWHSVSNTVMLLLMLAEQQNRRFSLVDDTFVLHRQRLQAFCDALQRRRPAVVWHCNGRINLVSESLIRKMAEAGCRSIFYGVESGSAKTLRDMHKGFAPEEAMEVVAMTRNYIPVVTVSFIWGFPNESWEDFQATRKMYMEMSQGYQVSIQLYLLTAYPGSQIYAQYRDQMFLDLSIESDMLPKGRVMVEEEIRLIRDHPSLFPCFYRFPTPELMRKLSALEEDRKWIQ